MGRLERNVAEHKPRDKVATARRNARFPRLYAHAGEHITCERGHVIATVARDVVVGAVFTADMVKDWHHKFSGLPGMSLKPCPECGASWVKAQRGHPGLLHIETGWRRTAEH